VRDLDASDPGWRLEQIEDGRTEIPDDKNGALRIVAFRKKLDEIAEQSDSPLWWPSQETRDWLDALEQQSPTAPLTDNEAATLRAELTRFDAAITIARSMSECAQGKFPTKHKHDGLSTPLVDHSAGNRLGQLLFADLMVRLHDKDHAAALVDCRASWNLSRAYTDEPGYVLQLMRSHLIRRAVLMIQKLLATTECSDLELSAFQSEITHAESVPMWKLTIRGERGMRHDFYSSLAAGDVSMSQWNVPFSPEEAAELPNAKDARRQHVWTLEQYTQLLAIGLRSDWEQLPLLKQNDKRLSTAPLFGTNLFKHLELEYASDPNAEPEGRARSVAAGVWRHHATLKVTSVALAVERYRLVHGEWPDDLAATAPQFLPAIPADPYDGKPVRYQRASDGVVIYSVGEDLVDNQGAPTNTALRGKGEDITFQLWDKALRK
jgi:hypothetical protein